MVRFAQGRKSSHDLEHVDPKYWENYTEGVDHIHCTKGTCNLSKLVGVKVIHEVTYQKGVFMNYLPFKTSQGIGHMCKVATCYC